MLRKLLVSVILLAIVGGAVFWFISAPQPLAANALAAPHTANVKNGETMFFAGGCSSCHAKPGQDNKFNLSGGLGLKSPFGTFYVPNISSDPNDGIGKWSETDFANAMLRGVGPGGVHLYPAFPYTSYQRMTLADTRDLYAFIKTLQPEKGRVRDHDLPFPFNIRRTLGVWKLLNLDGKTFAADTSKPADWNRGAYLVNGPGHCAECHSPRDLMGGIVSGQRFAGGRNPEGEGWVPNITQARLGKWSVGEIEEVLASGLNPDGDSVGGSMAPVVRNTGQLSPDDRKAMAAYIKSLPAVEGPKPPK
ncbi:nicotinate dehydrogenase subunit B [Variibacter gotjawalensis]|uniref:Nicotinate dehydrogenase subunit B n=1 Tax=Variibacter gotjawalensis TaxID=1333996 RepID=A0A0S3PUQ8_9BRAD|nr:cytochrome c [Variibacter gotjawalensis]NIK49997.1 mono/diheme cytochrome c family protein [Variibacter gotjawalensis]RZS45996.1 mono/diheme cytochrome c family protein [Variibacter gotjawalensis]BAT59671.1 nicotinate dehydrogenase subunit B [Variibacter gotjawalensis]